MFNHFAVALALASACSAALVPTAPGPGDKFNAGQACTIQYNADTTGTWDNVTVTLMTGSNFAMVPVAPVATGLDGTKGGTISTFTCPEVTIYGPIYFYQFEQEGEQTSWTTRFTIASSSGSTVSAPQKTVQGGSTIGYGTGKLVNAAATTLAAAAATTGSTANQTSSSVTASVRSTDSEASGFASIASTSLSPSATTSQISSTTSSSSSSTSASSSAAAARSSTASSGAAKIFTSLASIALAAGSIVSLL